MRITRTLTKLLLSLVLCLGCAAVANAADDTFVVELECSDVPYHQDTWPGKQCNDEAIKIPRGRPIYALLVSGFDQNRHLDRFHFYNFAKCLLEKGAYVHHAWWNNLLHPYMEKPLHSDYSVPSHGTWGYSPGYPHHDIYPRHWPYAPLLRLWVPYYHFGYVGEHWVRPTKAIPAEDYQFQKDARELLTRIREENPHALIILVGHSMGGDAVVRLADSMPATFDIELLAPIDPVGNRTCVPGFCGGEHLFTRYYTVREDWGVNVNAPERVLGKNIKYLYHRWQHEWFPPWDRQSAYLFKTEATTSPTEATVSDQSAVAMNLHSGLDVPGPDNFGGGLDGHGELVGFRGVFLTNIIGLYQVSNPVGLKVSGDYWPNGGGCPESDDAACRVFHLKQWQNDPNYMYKQGFEPWNPNLCMVSRDMCNILDELLAERVKLPGKLPRQ